MQKGKKELFFFLQKQNKGNATYEQQHTVLATQNATPRTH